jgi:hypothetical protein
MSVGVMENYKLRDLRASPHTGLVVELEHLKIKRTRVDVKVRTMDVEGVGVCMLCPSVRE